MLASYPGQAPPENKASVYVRRVCCVVSILVYSLTSLVVLVLSGHALMDMLLASWG